MIDQSLYCFAALSWDFPHPAVNPADQVRRPAHVGLTKSAALELAELGIRVNAIVLAELPRGSAPPVNPEMPAELVDRTPEIVEPWLASGTPIGRAGLRADIANAALWLASSESSFVTGHALVLDGGFTAGTRWSQTLERLENLKEHFRAALSQTAAVS